jgi:hypothetical protein
MRKTLLFLVFAVAAGSAQAQIKCWNENGKRVCGDAPPAGAKVTTLRAPSAGQAEPAPAAAEGAKGAASKDAKKGPLTPAEQEADYKKRQADSQKAAEKAAAEKKSQEAKLENCERAKAALRQFESGQRISRTNDKGERYFLEDAQLAQETAKARQTAQEACAN